MAIEIFVNCWAELIVGELENFLQADDEDVGQLFEVS